MWSGDDTCRDEVAQPHGNSDQDDDTEMIDTQEDTKAERRCGRERSLSVPCSSETSHLDSVMTKAKRASSYLWMLLHSQNCRLGVDRCTHAGCANAKLVHLHLKTCAAGLDFPCPARYEGCLQARKLLTHYRRCRNIRARQVGAPSLKGQHVCLICSMVARQARSLLDSNMNSCNNKSSSPQAQVHKKSNNNSKGQVTTSFTVQAKLEGVSPPTKVVSGRKIVASFTLSSDNEAASFYHSKGKHDPAGDWDMPPPAPRPRVSKSAPASPAGNSEGQELQGKEDRPLQPMALTRKRSESLGSSTAISRRAVSFAEAPEFLEHRSGNQSLVEVELDPAEEEVPGKSSRRVRSASCHLLTASSLPTESCGTIYEEIGPSSSYMDD